jgi:tellurium resistance protein TerD
METATIALNMTKGERVALVSKEGGALAKVHIGAGWDVNAAGGSSYDLDIFALCLDANGKLSSNTANQSILYFGNKTLPGLAHGGDNLTGQGDGDDEVISMDLSAMPSTVNAVLVGINIYNAVSKGGQNFGRVSNAFIRYADGNTPAETVKKYDLSEDYSAFNGVIACKIYRHEAGWKFQAVGEGVNGEIDAIANGYRA